MVSVAVLVLVMLAVSTIFNTVTQTSSLTTADIEISDTVDAIRRTMQQDLDNIVPGAMLLYVPTPAVHAPDFPLVDVPTEPPVAQARTSRLTFLVSGSPRQFESTWNPALTSSEALLTYTHGVSLPPGGPVYGDPNYALAEVVDALAPPRILFNRILSRRAILLATDVQPDPTVWDDDNWGHGLGRDEDLYDPALYLPPTSLGTQPWVQSDAFNELNLSFKLSLVDVLRGPTAADFSERLRQVVQLGQPYVALVDASYTPLTVPVRSRDRGQACFNLAPHVGEFIIEWTDGSRVDDDPTLPIQWFGLGRDVDGDGVIDPGRLGGDVISHYAYRLNVLSEGVPDVTVRHLTPFGVELGYHPDNEVAPPFRYGSSPGGTYGYWAVWSERNWQYRPKLIRVTLWLYDANKRVRHTTDEGPPEALVYPDQRLGLQRSFILEVP